MVKWISRQASNLLLGVRIPPEAHLFLDTMKKVYFILFLLISFLFLFSLNRQVQAAELKLCQTKNPDGTTSGIDADVDPATGQTTKEGFISKGTGLVPCGTSIYSNSYSYVIQYNLSQNPPNQKSGIITATSEADARQQVQAIASAIFSPGNWRITSITFLSGKLSCPCKLGHFFLMIARIYYFAVWILAVPFAALMVVVGGILILISGGNPGLFEKGRNILKYTFIALLLIFGSWLIINTVLRAIRYDLPWSSF